MSAYFGYARVSTAKQGEGVSLQEQQDAIRRYAARNDLEILEWFEEKETAAKRGRPVFTRMLRLLRTGKAAGVVIHKIDRSARNLKDWADLGELIDAGIEVHFANESLDLQSRGGRLSADIQAVVAADYIRNLREETRKGFYGRLKQGLYPLPAPLGYLDEGKGKPKTIDPVKGPLVRRAFELYTSGRYSLGTLGQAVAKLGLTNRNGGTVTRNGLSTVLNNPFYIGLIRIRKTGELFQGIHEPLISKALFDRVQVRLQSKVRNHGYVHAFQFRQLLTCGHCGYALIGERQKGHVYYRCHTKGCPTTSVREKKVKEAVRARLRPLEFSDREKAYLVQRLRRLRQGWTVDRDAQENALKLQIGKLGERLGRLTDAYLDGTIEKELFEEHKAALLLERRQMSDNLLILSADSAVLPDRVQEFLELAGSAWLTYKEALPEEQRELLEIVTSNRTVSGKNVGLELRTPFQLVAERRQNTYGDPRQDIPRTLDRLFNKIVDVIQSQLSESSDPESETRTRPSHPSRFLAREKGWKDAA